ncbi:MAG: hypothetical protein AAGG48_20160 [Planctomycetota bacterium]
MIRYGRSLFVHVPKTGGTWVRQLLLKHGGKTYSYEHDIPQRHRISIALRRSTPFCFVRHPVDFVYSVWKHWSGNPICRVNCTNAGRHKYWDKRAHAHIYCACVIEGDVNATLRAFTQQAPGFVSEVYRVFTARCRHVGRYESLRSDLARILHLIEGNLDPSLESSIAEEVSVNVSRGADQQIDPQVARSFMEREPCSALYGYWDLPDSMGKS